MSDDSSSDDKDFEYGRSTRRTTRSKRREGAAGKTLPTCRTTAHNPALLDPLHEALALAYADETSPDVDFEQIISGALPEYAEIRQVYIDHLPKDGLGRAVEPASESDIARAVSMLEQRGPSNALDALLLRKLKLHQHRTIRNIPSPILTSPPLSTLTPLPAQSQSAPPPPQVLEALQAIRTTPYENSFLSRLNGLGDYPTQKPVYVDWEGRAPWMDVMEDVRMHRRLKCPDEDLPGEVNAPITYVTLAKEHLPQIHDILRRTFWDGINVSDSLQYSPERATIVAVYKRLVVGVALLSSPQETYITYLAVREGWGNAQIATTMLYLLISRNPNKDFTLHVSANNPAMLLYNRFGFKAEEFVVGFYDAYLDPNARASKNAFRLRLRA